MCTTTPTGSCVMRSPTPPAVGHDTRRDDLADVLEVPVDAFEHRAHFVARLRIGLPISLVVIARALVGFGREQIAERAQRRAPGRRRRAPPTPAARVRARATFCAISPASVTATERTSSPVAGLRISSERSLGGLRGAARRPRRPARPPVRRPRGERRRSPPAAVDDERLPARFLLPGPALRVAARSRARSSRCNVCSMSSSERNECQRSVRCFSSPGVCGPRSSSTPSIANSRHRSRSVSSTTCRCFTTRWPVARTRRDRSFSRSDSSVRSTVASLYCTTGSRLVDWLHALISAFTDNG